jgi:hypothetical protein
VRVREAGNSGVGSGRSGVASRRDFFASVLPDGEFVALGETTAVRLRAPMIPGMRISKTMKVMRTFNTAFIATSNPIWTVARTVAMGAMLCGACAMFSSVAAAQAPAGPIRPAGDSGDPHAGSPGPAVRPEMVVPDKKQLFASWKFNVDDSDDAQDKMREARGTNADNPANPRSGGGNGTGIHMGGIGSPYPGGGGGNGGGGGGGNPRNGGSKNADSDYDRQQLQELMSPAGSITLAMKDTPDAMIRGGSARSIPMGTRCRNRRTINIKNSMRTGKTIGWWRMKAEVMGRRLLVRLSRLPVESNFMKLCAWKEHARTDRWKFALCMTSYQRATFL